MLSVDPGLRLPVVVAAGLAAAGPGCTLFDAPQPDDAVVRFVPIDETLEPLKLTARELRQELARRRVQISGDLDAPPLPAEVQRDVLDQMIEQALFNAHAKALKLTVSSTIVEAELTAMERDLPDAELDRILNETYQTRSRIRERIRQRLLTQKLLAEISNGDISDAEIEARWTAWDPEAKMHPPRVKAGQIVVSSEQTAKEVRQRLKQGVAFEQLAMEYSVAPNAAAGGYLGWFARKEMPEIVDETCFELEPGEVSDIVPSEYGYHIFKVYEVSEGRPVTLEEARDEIRRSIVDDRSRAARDRLASALRSQWKIEENEEKIREVFQWGR